MLDPDALANLRLLEKTEPGLAAEVVGTFLRNAPLRLAEARRGIAINDAAAIAKAAHALAGSCGTVGATPLGELAGRLESLARAGALADAAGLLAQADQVFPDVRRALQEATEAIGG
jgi:HPt (histidine-containing phosphotransfer) domain-containing protein